MCDDDYGCVWCECGCDVVWDVGWYCDGCVFGVGDVWWCVVDVWDVDEWGDGGWGWWWIVCGDGDVGGEEEEKEEDVWVSEVVDVWGCVLVGCDG